MFHKVVKESIYQRWLKCAADHQPKYDYFNFADLVMKSKRTTSTLYLTTLNKALLTSLKKAKPSIADAIALFNIRIDILFSRENPNLIIIYFVFFFRNETTRTPSFIKNITNIEQEEMKMKEKNQVAGSKSVCIVR